MQSKDFIKREDPAYQKTVVVRRHAKVARSVTQAELKQDYTEVISSIKQPDHLAKYRSSVSSPDPSRFERRSK